MTDIFVFVQQSLDFAKGIADRALRAGGSSAGYRSTVPVTDTREWSLGAWQLWREPISDALTIVVWGIPVQGGGRRREPVYPRLIATRNF